MESNTPTTRGIEGSSRGTKEFCQAALPVAFHQLSYLQCIIDGAILLGLMLIRYIAKLPNSDTGDSN